MKHVTLFVPLLAALAGVPSQAQNSTFMTANIPFNFELGKQEMPAGRYRIEYSRNVLWLRCREQNKQAAIVTIPKMRSDASLPAKGVLQFHRYGSLYFLAEVWTPYSAAGGELVRTTHEKELARLAAQPSNIALSTSH